MTSDALKNLAVRKLKWGDYKKIKTSLLGLIQEKAQALLDGDSGASLFTVMAASAQEAFARLDELQTDLIVACTNLTAQDVDELEFDEAELVFQKVIAKNPPEAFIDLEKNSPAGVVASRFVDLANVPVPQMPQAAPDASEAFDPGIGGSDTSPTSSEPSEPAPAS